MKTNAMKTNVHPVLRACLAAALAASCVSAGAALVEGRTSAGHRYLAGGIGIEEVDAMRSEAPRFSLQLITAAKTGAYLAGARIRITGPGNDVVLDTTIDAPWLLLDLPAGPYTVRVTHSGQTVERRMTIAPGKTEKSVFQFDVPVDGDGPTQATSPVRSGVQ